MKNKINTENNCISLWFTHTLNTVCSSGPFTSKRNFISKMTLEKTQTASMQMVKGVKRLPTMDKNVRILLIVKDRTPNAHSNLHCSVILKYDKE